MTHKLILLFASVLITTAAFAQRKLTEGSVLYDITISTGAAKPQNADVFNGATNAVYIKGAASRTEMVSSLGTQSTIISGTPAKKEVTILKEFGEQRYLISLTPDDWQDINKKYEAVTFTYDNSSTKTIQGYVARKAVGSLPDGTSFAVWYTPEITVDNQDFQYANRNLPGLALEYETSFGNLKVTYTASKIVFGPVPAAKFDLPKTGYRVVSYKESKGKS